MASRISRSSSSSLLLKFDAFRKIPTDLTQSSGQGAALTICAYGIMILLFLFEFYSYWSVSGTQSVELDTHYAEHIYIDFDVVMHSLPCKYTNVMIRDIVGQQEIEALDSKITKERIDASSGEFKSIHYDTDNSAAAHHSHTEQGEWVHPELEADWISTSDAFKHNSFDDVIKYHDFTFINFYAEWCIHCRRFAPTWIEAEKKTDSMTFYDHNNNEVMAKFLRINCVAFQDVCAKVGIRGYPTIRLYKKDGVFGEYHGERKADPLVDFFKSFIQSQEIQVNTNLVSHHAVNEEGCRVHGELKVRRVPGYFLLEADSNIDSLEPAMTNVSHKVNHLWFIDDINALKNYVKNTAKHVTKDVLKNVQPMKASNFIVDKKHMAPQHYLNVIPTIFDKRVIVYQATVQSHIAEVEKSDVPQARFTYSFSSMTINITTKGRPFYDFLTSVFAIVGGTYTLISLVDKLIYGIKKKLE